MSLNKIEKVKTINELQTSFENSGLTISKVATDLQTNEEYIKDLLNLRARRIEDPWILKNYLEQYNADHNKAKVIYTALKGDYHNYLFLDSSTIERASLK